MTVPYTFGNATTSIPLSNLDADFATPITLGNTNVYLGNTTTNINNLSLGNVSITSVGSTFPNSYLSNSSATLGNAVVTLGGTTTSVGNLTLTNVTISSVASTLPNSYLANSSVTINGTSVALGGSATITANAAATLTISTGLSGTSYNGGTAVTIAIDSTVATLTGVQTLTNKTINGSNNTLSNIPNSALTNNTVTVNGTSIALGASGTVTAAAGTLTGTTLNSTVVTSSLTAVGTITTGVWNGTAIGNTYLANSSVTVNGTSIALGASGTVTAAAGTLTGTTLNSTVVTSSLTSVGTIATGTWNGSIITGTYGGTGVNNGSNTITIAGNLTHAGAFTQSFTATANTAVTLPAGATASSNNLLSSATAVGIVTGTPSSTTYLRGDGTWATVSASGSSISNGTSNVTVNSSGGTVTIATAGTTALTVDTSQNVGIGTSSPSEKLHIYGANPYLLLQGSEASAQTLYMRESAGGLYFGQYGVGTRMLLDSSGNLGLGVTPSAWQSSFSVMNLGSNAYLSGRSSGVNQTELGMNSYYNSTWKYVASSTALRYLQDGTSGSHQWFNAPSGTAGNTISFTQAMTLDVSGNLALGLTSANRRLEVSGASSGETYQMRMGAGAANSVNTYDLGRSTADGYFRFYGNQSGANGYIWSGADGERARIDISGNLLVGTTGSGFNGGFAINPSSGNTSFTIGHVTGTTSGQPYTYFTLNNSVIGSITQSGTTAVLYNVTSDQRLKQNIQNADSASSLIDSLQVRQFDWKSDNSHQRYGFIAQELVTVAPEAVHQPADPEEMMAVDYSKLVPMLVKEIQSLRQRLSAANL